MAGVDAQTPDEYRFVHLQSHSIHEYTRARVRVGPPFD